MLYDGISILIETLYVKQEILSYVYDQRTRWQEVKLEEGQEWFCLVWGPIEDSLQENEESWIEDCATMRSKL